MFHRFLGFRTFLGKVVGLILAESSGFSIGKGPIRSYCTAYPHFLCVSTYFLACERLATSDLRCSVPCAVGVAGSFGATFGGVLFSIEVTTNFYMVRRLPQAVCCSVRGVLHQSVGWSEEYELLVLTSMTKDALFLFYGLFLILGTACGLLGAAFNALVQFLLRMRKRLAPDNHLRHGKLGGWIMLRNQLFVVWCLIAVYITAMAWSGLPRPPSLQYPIRQGFISIIQQSNDDLFDTLVMWPYLPYWVRLHCTRRHAYSCGDFLPCLPSVAYLEDALAPPYKIAESIGW